jgi:hypothetical protein
MCARARIELRDDIAQFCAQVLLHSLELSIALTRLASNLGKLLGTEDQQSDHRHDQNVYRREGTIERQANYCTAVSGLVAWLGLLLAIVLLVDPLREPALELLLGSAEGAGELGELGATEQENDDGRGEAPVDSAFIQTRP